MADKLPSGRWRARVSDPRTGKQVTPHGVIGGPKSFASKREAERAEDTTRDVLLDRTLRGVTVLEWWTTWTTDPLWDRKAESTNIHRAERTQAFAHEPRFRDRPVGSIGPEDVATWLKGGTRNSTVQFLRAWFNDGRRAQA